LDRYGIIQIIKTSQQIQHVLVQPRPVFNPFCEHIILTQIVNLWARPGDDFCAVRTESFIKLIYKEST